MVMLRELTQWIWASDVDSGIIGSIELNVWLAQLMGLPLLDIKTESKPQRIRILATSCIVLPCLLCYVCLEIYDLVLNWNDVDVMTQNVVETLTHLGYWFKVKVDSEVHIIPQTIYYSNLRFLTRTCVVSCRQRKTFHQVEVQNKLACLTYFCLTVFSSTMSLVMLLNEPDAMAGKRFPFRVYMPSWLPAPVQHLYMGLCLIVVCCGLTTIDNTNVLLMNQICLHLKVLNLSFEALELDLDRRLEVDPHSWMQSIVKYHCSLIDLRQRLERVYMLPVMFQFVSSLLVVAMTVFQMLLSDGSNSSVIMYFLLVGLMCQLFLYCWFGNEVFEQSKTLSISGFGCDWLQFDIRFRRCLLIFMVNAQRPLLFTAGGFMGLTLTSFANILGKSYSIVAVLRQMYGRAE